jgi:hypothetical protein
MQTSDTKRVGAFTDEELAAQPHLAKLPDETHIISGTLEGHGANALASDKAVLSSKIVKLERTASGGIEYQLAIFVSEPALAPVVEAKAKEDPNFLEAVEFFVSQGLTDTDARKKVNEFGVSRVLAAKNRALDLALEKTLNEANKPE